MSDVEVSGKVLLSSVTSAQDWRRLEFGEELGEADRGRGVKRALPGQAGHEETPEFLIVHTNHPCVSLSVHTLVLCYILEPCSPFFTGLTLN